MRITVGWLEYFKEVAQENVKDLKKGRGYEVYALVRLRKSLLCTQ